MSGGCCGFAFMKRPMDLPELPPGESFYDKALPILKKAWARRGRGRRDLATNPKYMEGFGR